MLVYNYLVGFVLNLKTLWAHHFELPLVYNRTIIQFDVLT